MSAEQFFCDWKPCALLQEFLKKYALPLKEPSSVQAIVFRRGSDIYKEPMRITTLYYCPFCGTRLHANKEILEWISEQVSKS